MISIRILVTLLAQTAGVRNNKGMQTQESVDSITETLLDTLTLREKCQQRTVPGVRTALVVLSSRAMWLDIEGLRQSLQIAYPDAAVFFYNTLGIPKGTPAPRRIDLLIDFTGPGQRQPWFLCRKLRRMARIAVGRNAGLLRKRIYDRIFDEKQKNLVELPENAKTDALYYEWYVQQKVLELAGVGLAHQGGVPLDQGKTIALELPLLAKKTYF